VTEQAETLLAFDYGEKHIGVAVGQTLTGTANPLESVRVTSSKPDWSAISRIVETWQPDALVVGLPLNMDGSEQTVTKRARRFGNQLLGRYRLPVHLVDERLTTREARDRLAAEGRPGGVDHPVAAQVILESWLNERKRAS
jgi:putative Holliday junction resolvase